MPSAVARVLKPGNSSQCLQRLQVEPPNVVNKRASRWCKEVLTYQSAYAACPPLLHLSLALPSSPMPSGLALVERRKPQRAHAGACPAKGESSHHGTTVMLGAIWMHCGGAPTRCVAAAMQSSKADSDKLGPWPRPNAIRACMQSCGSRRVSFRKLYAARSCECHQTITWAEVVPV
jgi:hypothetical protein